MSEKTDRPVVAYSKYLDENSLPLFLNKLREFNEEFCKVMYDKQKFTIRLEVNGDNGTLFHCRVQKETIEQNPDVGSGGGKNNRKKN